MTIAFNGAGGRLYPGGYATGAGPLMRTVPLGATVAIADIGFQMVEANAIVTAVPLFR